jgi:hypothetical protein
MYQTTHKANANTITPAQYQPRSASSLIGSPSLFREGLYTHSAARGRAQASPLWGSYWITRSSSPGQKARSLSVAKRTSASDCRTIAIYEYTA